MVGAPVTVTDQTNPDHVTFTSELTGSSGVRTCEPVRLATPRLSNRNMPHDLGQLSLQADITRVEEERHRQEGEDEAVGNQIGPAIDADSRGKSLRQTRIGNCHSHQHANSYAKQPDGPGNRTQPEAGH